MQNKYRLFKRRNVFYVEDTETGKQTSLHTRDKEEARASLEAKNNAHRNPSINLVMAKAYLSAHDPRLVQRTWRDVMDEFL